MVLPQSSVDVVGLGLNATDTVLVIPEFPALGGKVRISSLEQQAGGQVATALVTCQRLGLRSRYIGKVGDDEGGRIQLESLRREGLDTTFVRMARSTPNQLGVIIVEKRTGERTVLWDRNARLAVKWSDIQREAIDTARALHIDGCDVEAALRAARWARQAGIPVSADLDTAYAGVEKLFRHIDYLIASASFFPAVTGCPDPFRAIERTAMTYGNRAVGMTLGRDGALVYSQGRFHYSPGFVVNTVDTTGAGDVFHGAFIYGVLAGWPLGRILDFANAMAALNCTAMGARGHIASRRAAERLMASGKRHVNHAYSRGARSGASKRVRSLPWQGGKS